MKTILKASVFPFSVVLLMAAAPVWKSKQMEGWTEQDAKVILTNSPWVKKVTPALMPPLNEDNAGKAARWEEARVSGWSFYSGHLNRNRSIDGRKTQAQSHRDSRNPLGKRAGRACR